MNHPIVRSFGKLVCTSAVLVLGVGPQVAFSAPPAPAAGQPPPLVLPGPQPEDKFVWFVGDQAMYDDNLFRLSPGVGAPAGSESRTDEINTLSAGLTGQWYYSRQKLAADLRIDNNTFVHNQKLSNLSGFASLIDDWTLGSRLSGRVEASYNRTLPGFANNRLFFRNLLDNIVLLGEGRFAIGSHWFARAMAESSQVIHDRTFERVNDSHSRSTGFGLEYATSGTDYPGAETFQTTAQDLAIARQTIIGVDYWHTDITYPPGAFLDAEVFDRNFHESTVSAVLASPLSPKTTVRAKAGYLKRDYLDAEAHSYSGGIWDASLVWRVTDQTRLSIEAWRALRSFLEVNTDYFVSRLYSITWQWLPTEQLTIGAGFSTEHQDYLGASLFATTSAPRVDNVRSGQVAITYAVGRFCEMSLSGNYDTRDSNQPLLSYHDTRAAVGLRAQF